MMTATQTSFEQLYRETVLDHSRSPRHFGRLEHPDLNAEGDNPLCGDKVSVYLVLSGQRIEQLKFEASACAICTASASIMSELESGRSTGEARTDARRILEIFKGKADIAGLPGDMAALASVREYPSRIKCATLPWQTLLSALGEKPPSKEERAGH